MSLFFIQKIKGGGVLPVESSNKVRTQLRKKVTNKDDLIIYLNSHPDSEYPFVESAWDNAVKKCKENEGKQDKETYKLVIDEDGFEHKKKTHTTKWITNPCRMYFKLMSLKNYATIGEALKYEKKKEYENEREVVKVYLNKDEERQRNDNEILDWIEMFAPDEREFLKKRYYSYYDTYDINDGADRVTFKRLLSLEVEAFRIDVLRAEGKSVNINDEKKINEMLQSTLESLKWTKKQRSARDDMAKNRFTIWMEDMATTGEFVIEDKEYPKDDIDFLIDTMLKSTAEMMS